MPISFRLSRRALQDLRAMCKYIADDNPSAAFRVEEAILSACELLSRKPEIGSERKQITDLPVRFWTVTKYTNYQIVYRPETKPLQIVAILHGARNLTAVLKS